MVVWPEYKKGKETNTNEEKEGPTNGVDGKEGGWGYREYPQCRPCYPTITIGGIMGLVASSCRIVLLLLLLLAEYIVGAVSEEVYGLRFFAARIKKWQ